MAAKKAQRSVRKGLWKKNGKGLGYTSSYLRDNNGERVIVLTAFRKNNSIHNVTSESASALKKLGWVKVA